MKLDFKKNKKREPEQYETGYYFKGEFLSRYLTQSLDILRERIKNKIKEWKSK